MNARTLASAAAAVTGLATVYVLALLLGLPDPEWAGWTRAVVHLGELAALLALVLSGAAGSGWLGRTGVVLGATGLLLMAVGEPTPDGALSDTIFAIGPNLIGLGLILTGVAVLRAGVWSGWRRVLPLVFGIYVFVPMTPMIIVSGGPPAPLALVALVGWELLWVLVAVAVLTASTADQRRPARAV